MADIILCVCYCYRCNSRLYDYPYSNDIVICDNCDLVIEVYEITAAFQEVLRTPNSKMTEGVKQ